MMGAVITAGALPMPYVEGKCAVVTGAASGIGRALARQLNHEGCALYLSDIKTADLDATIASLPRRDIPAQGRVVDVADRAAMHAWAEDIARERGQVDIVINNAGILRDKSFANMEISAVEAVIGVHLLGAFYVSLPAFRVMKEKSYGRFVFTTSNAGLFGNFGQANYGAAKAGLAGLSNVLAIEGAKYNIKSNAIAPVARTRMTEDLLGPFADMVLPEQVTPMVVYLCSEANPYTHEIFTAGGGRYGRIAVVTNNGWIAGQGVIPSVEEIADHLDEIRNLDEFVIPESSNDEIMLLGRLLAS